MGRAGQEARVDRQRLLLMEMLVVVMVLPEEAVTLMTVRLVVLLK